MNHKLPLNIPENIYSQELENTLEEFRQNIISKMEEIKQKFNLTDLEISHAYRHRIWVHVNTKLIVNCFMESHSL